MHQMQYRHQVTLAVVQCQEMKMTATLQEICPRGKPNLHSILYCSVSWSPAAAVMQMRSHICHQYDMYDVQ